MFVCDARLLVASPFGLLMLRYYVVFRGLIQLIIISV